MAAPVPQAVAVKLVDPATHEFVVPQATLRSPEQMTAWLNSEAASTIMDTIQTLGMAIEGVKLTDNFPKSPVCPWWRTPRGVGSGRAEADGRARSGGMQFTTAVH